jgi:hypothetical protein
VPKTQTRPRLRSVRPGRDVIETMQQAPLASTLRDMPPEEVRCRSGWHRWARDTVLPGEAWPDSVRAWPDNQGRIKIEDPCLDCGLAWRVTKTLPGGEMDAFAVAHIIYDKDWVRVPQGQDRRKRTIRQEGYRRAAKKNSAQLHQALNRTAARGAEPHVPEARFAGPGVS